MLWKYLKFFELNYWIKLLNYWINYWIKLENSIECNIKILTSSLNKSTQISFIIVINIFILLK